MKFALLILTFIFCSFDTEQLPVQLILVDSDETYDWHDCVNPTTEYIKQQLPEIKKHFGEFLTEREEFTENLHFIDLNNDNQLDVLYAGNSGSEADFVVFLLNNGKGYDFLFEEYTAIAELTFENKWLTGYTGIYNGCCAEYIRKFTKYSVSKTFKRTVEYQQRITNYTEFPDFLFEKPKKFSVEREIYKLRASPLLDDTSVFIFDTISNVVATYKKGAIGYAWSEKKDQMGRSWWFVEMEPTTRQAGSRLSTDEDTIPFSCMGWMSANYLKEL